jgi:hypothetical protein
MIQIPPQVGLQCLDGSAQMTQRARKQFALDGGLKLGQALAQPADQREQLAQLGGALPFGTVTQAHIGTLFVARLP